MGAVILLSLLFIILIMLIVMTYYLRSVKLQQDNIEVPAENSQTEKSKENVLSSQTFIYTAIVLTSVGIIVSFYMMVRGTIWEGHLMEWLNIVVRLMHITFGIAWIGASFCIS